MSSVGSVTQSFFSLRNGVEGAASQLVQHFLPILRKRIAYTSRSLRIHDEDDIAISAFYELCKAVEQSKFEDISDRTQLWQVLSMIAVRKANDFRKLENAEKRGANLCIRSLEDIKSQVAVFETRPDVQLEVFEQCEAMLRNLKNPKLKKVAKMKMRGLTNAEISTTLGITTRSTQLMVVKIKEAISARFQD